MKYSLYIQCTFTHGLRLILVEMRLKIIDACGQMTLLKPASCLGKFASLVHEHLYG